MSERLIIDSLNRLIHYMRRLMDYRTVVGAGLDDRGYTIFVTEKPSIYLKYWCGRSLEIRVIHRP